MSIGHLQVVHNLSICYTICVGFTLGVGGVGEEEQKIICGTFLIQNCVLYHYTTITALSCYLYKPGALQC